MSEKVPVIAAVGDAGMRVTGYDIRVGPTVTHLDLFFGTDEKGNKRGSRNGKGPKITLNLEDRIEGEIIQNLIRAHKKRRQVHSLNERLNMGLIKELPAVRLKLKTSVRRS